MAGVDGRKLSNEFVESIVPPLSDISSRLEFPKELTKGEVGCFLSHRKCWQKLLESKEKWALILEDDIYISRRAKKYMTEEGWIPNDAGFVQLHIHRSGKYYVRPGVIRLDNNETLYRIFYPYPMGAQSYIISREAAEDALDSSVKITAPVDEFMFAFRSKFSRRHKIYTLTPTVVAPQDVPSTIEIEQIRSTRGKPLLARIHPKVLLFKIYVLILKVLYRKWADFRFID